MARIAMSEPLLITFRYAGPEVEEGEMEVTDVIEALDGFSGAYRTVASQVSPSATHQLRLTALDKHSFDMYISAAIAYVATGGKPLEQLENVTNACKFVFRIIANVIGMTKHVKAKPYNFVFKNNGDVGVINAEKVELVFPPDSFKFFKEGLLREGLKKIARPLRQARIDEAELKTGEAGPLERAVIEASEREYFLPEKTTTKSERQIVGVLISLNKETNHGLFAFGDGKRVQYHYIGNDDVGFYRAFGQKKGSPLRVRGIVYFDENLNPTAIDITHFEALQNELFSTNS
jgi:hypothetical protein